MFAILPLLWLVFLVVIVAAMSWYRPHPNHLFFLALLETHLREDPEPRSDSAEAAKSSDAIPFE